MRKSFAVLISTLSMTIAGFAQSSTEAKPSGTTKAPVHHAATANPTAIFETTAGTMRCELFPKQAPIGVANFIGLATGTKDWINPVSHVTKHNTPLYDGTIFHRVIPNFMIQGGDPAGNGSGDPGYKFKNEVSPSLLFDRPGRLAYANSGPDTNGSQFFITEVSTPHLNGGYTIFGQCDDASVEIVKQIARMARDPMNDRPFRPIKIIHVKIVHGVAARPASTASRSRAMTKPADPQ